MEVTQSDGDFMILKTIYKGQCHNPHNVKDDGVCPVCCLTIYPKNRFIYGPFGTESSDQLFKAFQEEIAKINKLREQIPFHARVELKLIVISGLGHYHLQSLKKKFLAIFQEDEYHNTIVFTTLQVLADQYNINTDGDAKTAFKATSINQVLQKLYPDTTGFYRTIVYIDKLKSLKTDDGIADWSDLINPEGKRQTFLICLSPIGEGFEEPFNVIEPKSERVSIQKLIPAYSQKLFILLRHFEKMVKNGGYLKFGENLPIYDISKSERNPVWIQRAQGTSELIIANEVMKYIDKNENDKVCLIHNKNEDEFENIEKFKHPKWTCLNTKDAIETGREFDIVILFDCEPRIELLAIAKKNIIFM
jgi:hypothetical protein